MEPTVINQITSELLCYIQNKMSTNDHDFIIKTVTEFYSETDITSAKKLLFDSCEETALRLITYRVNAPKLNCRDIISKMTEVGANCPIFVAVNIAKLPIVTADAFSIAKITKDFSSILNIEQHVINSLTTLADLQNDMRAVVDKCSMIDTISGDLDTLKSAVNRCIIRRRIESDSSVPESISPSSTHSVSTSDDDGDVEDNDVHHDGDDDNDAADDDTGDDNNDDNDNDNNDVFEDTGNRDSQPHSITDAAHSNDGNHDDALRAVSAVPAQPVLRLRDGPLHPNKWLTEGGFTMVPTTTDKKKTITSRTYVNSTRKNLSNAPLKTVTPMHHGNDRRHGGYNRSSNNDCEIFISRLIPETTTRDVINYVKPRLNKTVRVKQLRAKHDGYASFVLYVPRYLKNKVIHKAFWETDSIYVREFVQKSRF